MRTTGLDGAGKKQASRLCAEIDGRARDVLPRPTEGDRPRFRLDATCVKVRWGGPHRPPVAITLAVGVNGDGRREVVGFGGRRPRGGSVPARLLRGLARRGLRGVKLVVSDAHGSGKTAVARCCGPPGKGAGRISV